MGRMRPDRLFPCKRTPDWAIFPRLFSPADTLDSGCSGASCGNMNSSDNLSRSETWRLLILVGASVGILVNTFQGDGAPLVASIALSGIAFAMGFSLIRWLGPVFLKAGLKGKDMSKPRRPEMYVYSQNIQIWEQADDFHFLVQRQWEQFVQLFISCC